MRAQQQTIALAVAVVLLGGLDLAVHTLGAPSTTEALPALPPFDPGAVERVTLGAADDPLVLERRGAGWWIVAPSDAAADAPTVTSMLEVLAGGVVPQARIDVSDHERYGLAGGTELRIDVFGQDRTLLALYLGHDAGGGSTWVRWPDDDTVYRARIGGRATYDRSPRSWRDRTVTDLDPASVTALRIEGEGAIALQRGEGGWSSPSLAVDGPLIEQLVANLAGLRGLEIAAPDLIVGAPRVWLSTDTEQIELGFEQVGQLWFVGRAGSDERWRSAAALPQLLATAPTSLRDRHLWATISGGLQRLERTAHGAVGRGLLQRDGEDWRLVAPPNVDLDPRRAAAAAQWLSRPRVDAWAQVPAAELGFDPPRRWRLHFEGGQVRTIELGEQREVAGAPRVAIRDSRHPERAGWVDARIVAGIEAVFGD